MASCRCCASRHVVILPFVIIILSRKLSCRWYRVPSTRSSLTTKRRAVVLDEDSNSSDSLCQVKSELIQVMCCAQRLTPTFVGRKWRPPLNRSSERSLTFQSKLGMAIFSMGLIYFASIASERCPVCSLIWYDCRPAIAAVVTYPARKLWPDTSL